MSWKAIRRAAAVVATVLAMTIPAAGVDWQRGVVDDGGTADVGRGTSIQTASNGHFIAYYDATSGDLKLALFPYPSMTPTHVTVDDAGDVGQYASLQLDSEGRKHISYYDATNGKLNYAYWNGSQWNRTTNVDNSGTEVNVGRYTSLRVNGLDRPAIAYYDATNGNVKYAAWDGVEWKSQTVDSTGNVGEYASLAIDSSGTPHVAYYDATNGNLKYASWDGSNWQPSTVDNSTNDVGQYASLTLDNAGNAHIAYYDATDSALKYVEFDGSDWTEPTIVDNVGDVGQYASLALDFWGDPGIAYFDATDNNLKYAHRTAGAGWEVLTIDTTGDVGRYASLDFYTGPGYEPAIAYYDATNGNLNYAIPEPATMSLMTLGALGFLWTGRSRMLRAGKRNDRAAR